MMIFEKSEFLARLDNTKARMAAQGLEVLLVADPANMNYLTGYDAWSFYVPQMLLLAGDEAEPIWIGRAQDANGAGLTTYLDPSNIVGYPDHYVQSEDRHPMDFVADLVKHRGWDRRTFGLDMEAYYFTPRSYLALIDGLPNATFKSDRLLVNWVRSIKSPREIELMGQAARIVERMMWAALEIVAPGRRQCDAVAAISHAQVAGTAEFGGDYAALVPMLPTGIGTSAPHLTWSDKPFVKGEATILELAGVRRRYHCPMARTLHLGAPPPHLVDTAKIVVEGLENALAAAKPGATCEEVEAAWRETIARHGIVKDSRIGYSTGLNYPPDWGEHTMSLRPGDRTVLRPGMTLHCIPGIWMDDWGLEISECFRVTEAGAETFCTFDRELFIIE